MDSEKVLVAALLAVPVIIVALFAWPAVFNWAMEPPAVPAPQPAGAAATSAVVDRAMAPTPRPTVGAPPTILAQAPATQAAPTQAAPAATTEASTSATASAPPASTVQPRPEASAAATPSEAVTEFYALVSQRQYTNATQLWSARMQADYPPQQNINQRFSQTRSMQVRRADVISQDPAAGQAAVAVDVVESTSEGARHWVGTWYLVRGPSGWLLDQPQLAPG